MEKNQICFNHFKLYLKEQKNASRGSKQKLRDGIWLTIQ